MNFLKHTLFAILATIFFISCNKENDLMYSDIKLSTEKITIKENEKATFTVCNTSMYFNEKKNYFLSKNLIFRYKDKQTGTLVYDHPSEKYNVGILEEEMIVCIFTGL